MKKNFDDLADDFLNEDKNNGKKPNKQKDFNPFSFNGGEIDINNLDGIPPEIRDLIKTISDIKKHGGSVEDELNLGEPDEHETRDEDGNTFDKKTWETDFGSVTRITIGGELPSDLDGNSIRDLFRDKFGLGTTNKSKELTLEEKLEKAIESEDYLEAAKLRDKISEKNKESENKEKPSTEGDSEDKIWDLLD